MEVSTSYRVELDHPYASNLAATTTPLGTTLPTTIEIHYDDDDSYDWDGTDHWPMIVTLVINHTAGVPVHYIRI